MVLRLKIDDKKASLNAPLLYNIFKNNSNINVIIHNHHINKEYITLPYAAPGTFKDSYRDIKDKVNGETKKSRQSFNIKYHGSFQLIDFNLEEYIKEYVLSNIDTFNEKYPTKDTYEYLYKKYIKKEFQFDKILDFNYEKKNVLDLCGGAGYIAEYLYNQGANVSYLDQSFDMVSDEVLKNKNKKKYITHINNKNLIDLAYNTKYDFIFCQQAINYWFKDVNVENISNLLKDKEELTSSLEDRAYFIFNTFELKNNFVYKEYYIDDILYIEISICINDIIYHIQFAFDKYNFIIHKTTFSNISIKDFKCKLEKYFHISIISDNNARYFVCEKI